MGRDSRDDSSSYLTPSCLPVYRTGTTLGQRPWVLESVVLNMKLANRMKYYFNCPQCGQDEQFTSPVEESGLGCALLFFGGFIPALLYSDARFHRVQCEQCGYMFRQPTLPKTGVAKLAVAILLTQVLAAGIAVTMLCNPDLARMVPQPVFLEDLRLMASPNANAYVVLAMVTSVTIVVICLLASACSSMAYRLRLSKECELKPKRKKAVKDRQQAPGTYPTKATDGLAGNAQE